MEQDDGDVAGLEFGDFQLHAGTGLAFMGRYEHCDRTGGEHAPQGGTVNIGLASRHARGDPAPVFIFKGEKAEPFDFILESKGYLRLAWSRLGETDEDVAMFVRTEHGSSLTILKVPSR